MTARHVFVRRFVVAVLALAVIVLPSQVVAGQQQ